MKVQSVFLWLLLVLFSGNCFHLRNCLLSVDVGHLRFSFDIIKETLQKQDVFRNVTILSTLENLQGIKPIDVCCMTRNLLAFYLDKVFKNHQESNSKIEKEISNFANSFLQIQETLQQCEQSRCQCSEEATNATSIIQDNYNQLETRAAAIKSLGELNIFLAWINKNLQEASHA
ncbi:interleukin-19 [Thomomys bottae]